MISPNVLILVNPTPFLLCGIAAQHTGLSDDNSERDPPDSIPNSEVKPLSADGSVVRPCESRTSSGF